MKASATTIDLLTYKIETLEKRIEQLEAAREGREKELLTLLVNMLSNKEQPPPTEYHAEKKCTKATTSQQQSAFSIISAGRRRTMV
jgi:septal ring factor EnvC (AmiA/AmiB activator)